MGYELRSMTASRGEGLWARPTHTMDSFYSGNRTFGHTYSIASGTWPSANYIVYVPVRVKQSVLARKLWYLSESTGTGNIDIGLYNRAGSRLVNSGTVAKTAAAQPTMVDVTDTRLLPDLYYVALQGSNATDTYRRLAPGVPLLAAFGIRGEAAGGFGLPATATWTVDQTLAFCPEVGIEIGTIL